jgi:hypothetical protein
MASLDADSTRTDAIPHSFFDVRAEIASRGSAVDHVDKDQFRIAVAKPEPSDRSRSFVCVPVVSEISFGGSIGGNPGQLNLSNTPAFSS